MGYEIKGIAHVGCLVKDRDATIEFLDRVLGIHHHKSHFIDYEENSRIMGIPDSVMKIGFAKEENRDIILEMIEYVKPSQPPMVNNLRTIGASMISFLVPSISEILKKCVGEKEKIVLEESEYTGGPFPGCRHAILLYDNFLYFELVEAVENRSNRTRVCKISYLVREIEPHVEFYKQFGLEDAGSYRKDLGGGRALEGTVLKNQESDFYVELLKNRTDDLQQIEFTTGSLGLAHVCYHVEGISDFYQELIGRDVEFTDAPVTLRAGLNTGAKATYMTAPDNIKIEIYEGRLLEIA
ncbi:VOC family protein [Diplocloster hominis]|uniref:VOC family protein n=1 Tax=Diplocloster hominis TaxID=3079010 RepID=UPI0031B9F934